MDSDPQSAISETASSVSSNQRGITSAASISPDGSKTSKIETPSRAGKGLVFFASAKTALLISVLVVVGSYSILPIWLFMGHLWLNDPLRAIGSVFPLVAFAGTLVAWRRIGWSMNGSFWGLPIIALSILLARITSSFMLNFRVHEYGETALHPAPVVFLYGVGAVLLFGGTRLLRAAIAPLCLLLFINPVPYLFNTVVDLPLQFLSANTARHFAHLIGLQPSGEQLRMMFSPTFGMMIVPGCNGVRGSVTLGYLALIYGYVRHLRARALILTALGAFLMGYALNLLRLCVLVVYYRIGLSFTSIQPYGAGVDYAIGCTLFLFATLGVGLFIRWIEPESQKTDAAVKAGNAVRSRLRFTYATAARVGCFLILTLAFIVPTFGKGNSMQALVPNEKILLASFPNQVGSYQLIRTYPEYDSGAIRFVLADYSGPPSRTGTSRQLTLGLYVGAGMHFVSASRFAQGIRPEWTGTLDTSDASGQQPLKVHFVTTLYDDGASREYDAESACYETGCSASVDSSHQGFFVGAPKFSDLAPDSNSKRLTILLRQKRPDNEGTPADMQRSQFETDVREFTEQLNLRTLLQEVGTPI